MKYLGRILPTIGRVAMSAPDKQRVNIPIFAGSVAPIAILVVLLIGFPTQAESVIDTLFTDLCSNFGWLFLGIVVIISIFSLIVAISPWGAIKLGGPDEEKQYSNFTWAAMLFTAGLGTALVVMSYIEPVMFMDSPPFGIERLSEEAFEFALVPDQFLFGFLAWLVYIPGVIAVGLALYVRREQKLRLSTACGPAIGKHSDTGVGALIDVLGNVAVIGGISSALGLGVPIITTLVNKLTGIPQGMWLTLAVLLVWTAVFASSVYLGLDKGIKRLSTFNVYLFGAVIIFVATVNPISDAIHLWVSSLGLMFDNFGKLAFGVNAFGESDFTQNWVVFYWAWWLTYAPMMGLFVARISRGRTVRQIIGGMMVFGALACMMCFAWFGSYSVSLQHSGAVDLVSIFVEAGREEAFYAILETMPLAPMIEVAYIVLLFVFCATSIDSTAYVLASTCVDNLSGDEQPKRWIRMAWAILLLLFTLGLVVVGGLQTLQTATVLTGLPMVAVVTVLMFACVKGLGSAAAHDHIDDSPAEASEETQM